MSKKTKPPEPPLPPEAECLAALESELEAWQHEGLEPRLFLRDDDAIEPSPALEKLTGICEKHTIPLLLATIPKPAEKTLANFVRNHPLITPAVHGYRHKNHSPKGEKTCELGRHRPLPEVMGELRQGREKLLEIFDGNLSQLLVPPWNRIHDEVLQHVTEAGFSGISTHAWLKQPMPLPTVNTHVDIMHWSGGTVGREPNWVWNQLAINLRTARAKGGRAIGVLTHHLVHDDKAWHILEQLAERFDGRCTWVAADHLLSEPPEPMPDDLEAS